MKGLFKRKRQFNTNNWTPLHFVANQDLPDIGNILILKGADINARAIKSQYLIIFFEIMMI